MAELVEGARLEIAYTLIAYQGFESLSLRHVAASCISLAATFLQKSPACSFRSVSFSVKGHATPLLLACKHTRHASACYRPFSWQTFNFLFENAATIIFIIHRYVTQISLYVKPSQICEDLHIFFVTAPLLKKLHLFFYSTVNLNK